MNILVTGGTGFLGTHLVRRLESQGHDVYVSNTRQYNLDKIEAKIAKALNFV